MSEGSFWPKTWKEALPLIVWGILIFAAGFEGIASLVHGEWISSGASFAIMLGLTAMLLHWKAWLSKVDPNWIVGAAIVLLLVIVFSPFIRQGRWPPVSWESVGVGVLGALSVLAIIGAALLPFIANQKLSTEAVPQIEAQNDGQTHIDLIRLLEFAVDQATVLFLADLIMKAPMKIPTMPLKLDGDLEAAQTSADFVRHVSVNLGGGTFRRQDFLNWMAHAEAEAENKIEQTPQDKRPAGVDPLVVRRCAIANLQCLGTLEFLQHERREVEQKLLAQRSGLIDQLRLRSPNR